MSTLPPPSLCVGIEHFGPESNFWEVQEALCREGLSVTGAGEDLPAVKVVLFDEVSPWGELLERISFYRKSGGHAVAVSMQEHPLESHRMWSLLENGAEEVIMWRRTARPASIISARLKRWRLIDQVIRSPRVSDLLIGRSECWRRLLSQVVEVACFSNAPVLLMGESGTGKELIAKLIHDLDRRPNKKDLIIVDCASIVADLSGSEFFGHEKGAFTNAVADRHGAFALADEGTLFLDEIGELPPNLQSELLRVIQEGTYKRVGSNTWKFTDFRLISATNRRLPEEVKRGRFREDLYYRISTCVCWTPPLRDRSADIPELARHFFRQILAINDPPLIDEPVLHYLINRDYPGNVRELRQLVTRMAYRHCGTGPITVGDIPEADRPCSETWNNRWDAPELERLLRLAIADGIGLKEIKRLVSNKIMDLAIDEAHGNLQLAAQRLQVTDRTLQVYQASRKNGASPIEE